MSDHDKMMAFGNWLASRQMQVGKELFDLGINSTASVARIRVKAGHLEATAHILTAFKELYNGDLRTFNKDYLGIEPDEEEKEEMKDGTSQSST